MTTTAAPDDALRAPRIRQRVLVARGHPEPGRVRDQMHEALSRHLGEALADAFAMQRSARDDSVWRIRTLALEVAVTTQWDAPLVARAWAAELAQVVRQAMAGGGDGENVMRWPSRADYLASYVRDTADGRADTRWWFASFAGLRLLTRSAQIRSALVRDPALGTQALLCVPPAELALVASALSGPDAATVLHAIAPQADDGDADAASGLLAASCTLSAAPVRGAEPQWALRVVVEALRAAPLRRVGALAGMARAMACFATIVAEQPARAAIVRRLLRDGNAAGLRVVLDAADAERLAPLTRIGHALAQALCEQLAQAVRPTLAEPAAERSATWMPIAAPLMLAPLLAALPFGEATLGWPAIGTPHDGHAVADAASPAALARLFALAIACGGERCARVLADPITRRLAGVGERIDLDTLRRWAMQLDDAHAASFERAIGDARRGARTAHTGPWLLAGTADERHVLLIDGVRGHWLALRADADLDACLATLRPWWHLAVDDDPAPACLVTDERLAAAAMRQLAGGRAVVPLAGAAGEALAASPPLAVLLARIDRLGDDVAWLAPPPALGLPPAIALAFAAVAHGLLRDLAWRIPGFARASLPHLWTNFLDVDAQVEREPGRLVARVSRPPLAVVLGMTGILRDTCRLPWGEPGGLQLALYPADPA